MSAKRGEREIAILSVRLKRMTIACTKETERAGESLSRGQHANGCPPRRQDFTCILGHMWQFHSCRTPGEKAVVKRQ